MNDRPWEQDFDDFDWEQAHAQIAAAEKAQGMRRCQQICLGWIRHGNKLSNAGKARAQIYTTSRGAREPFPPAQTMIIAAPGGATTVGYEVHKSSGGAARIGLMVVTIVEPAS
jgi:hypothetical protein